MKITRRLHINSLVSFALVVVIVPLLLWSTGELQRVENNDILADDIQTLIFKRETLRDAYFLDSDERARQQWQALTDETSQLLRQGANQFTSREKQQVLGELRTSFEATIEIFQQLVARARIINGTNGRMLHDDETGKYLYSQIMLKASALQEAAGRLQQLTRHRSNQTVHRAIILITTSIFLLLLVTVLNAAFIIRLMRKRLAAIFAGAEIIGQGNFNYRIDRQGSDELADLTGVINTLAARVQDHTQQLQLSHELLDGLSRQVPGILFQAHLSVDGHFSIPYASEAMHEIYGLSPADAIDDAAPIFSRFHPDDHDRLLDSFHASARTLTPWESEYRVILPRQGITWCHGLARPQRLADGSTVWHGFVSDISGRKAMEEALRESENRVRQQLEELSLIYAFTPVGLFAVSRELRFLRINERLAEINGKPIAEHLGRSIDEVLPADLAKTLRQIWQPVLERGEVVLDVELQGTVWWSPDVPRHWLANYHPLRSGNGDIIGLMGSVMDITERKQAEEALQQSENRYRAVVEDQTEVICRFQVDGTLLFVNDVYCRFFGRTAQELVGTKWQPRALPEDVSLIEQKLGEMSPATSVVVIENRVFSGSGTMHWMQFVNRGFYDQAGELIEIQAVGRDITERRLAEAAAQRSECFLRETLDAIAANICVLDEQGTILNVNKGWHDFAAANPPVPRNIDRGTNYLVVCDTALGDDQHEARQFAAGIRAVLSGETDVYSQEYPCHSDVQLRWFQGRVTRFADADTVRVVIVHENITERKLAEEILQGARNTLEQQVVERTASLSLANQQLQAEIEERKRIELDLLAHQQQLEVMTRELALAEVRERDRIAGELHDQVGQRLILGKMKLHGLMSRLPTAELEQAAEEIDSVLDQSIQDIRSLTFQIRPPILANAGLEAALQWLGAELREDLGLEIDFLDDRQPKPLKYEVRSMVFQAVRELLLNVAKHAGTNQALVRTKREGDFITVEVADQGVGFDSDVMKQSSAKAGGFGLFNVRQRIEFLGGSFIIAAAIGSGTRVTIRVPLAPAHA